MSLSADLLQHSYHLVRQSQGPQGLGDVDLRRGVSAAYYALYHRITGDAVKLLAPHVDPEIQPRINRWFDHLELRKVCGRFLNMERPLRDLIGPSTPMNLEIVAKAFLELQEARNSADYDLAFQLTEQIAWSLYLSAEKALQAWRNLDETSEQNIFILSLLLWKNWEDKERR